MKAVFLYPVPDWGFLQVSYISPLCSDGRCFASGSVSPHSRLWGCLECNQDVWGHMLIV